MHEVLVNRLGGLSLPRKSVVRLTDRPDMTLDVYRGRKTTIQHWQNIAYPDQTAPQEQFDQVLQFANSFGNYPVIEQVESSETHK